MRIEQITAQALKNVNFDRYLLASAVGKRAEQLSKGAQPLVTIDIKKFKFSDIALREIAEGKLTITFEG